MRSFSVLKVMPFFTKSVTKKNLQINSAQKKRKHPLRKEAIRKKLKSKEN